MHLDIVTLMVCDAGIAIFIGIALLFYQMFHKTYSGFGFWTIGSFISAFGYSSLILRGGSQSWISICIIAVSFTLVALFRLDGMMRFMRGAVLGKIYYLLALIIIFASSTYFHFVLDNVLIRNLILSFGVFLSALFIARELILYGPARKRLFYHIAAILNVMMGFEVLVGAMFFFFESMINSPRIPDLVSLHQLMIIFYEISWCLVFIMMNNQRLEGELHQSQEELQASLDQLKTAMSEIKTLSGLLPICSICHKVRDDKGYWNRLEAYISSHSEAEFSHGICPECAKTAYPELDLKNKME